MSLALSKDELSDYLAEVFPQVWDEFAIDDLTEDSIVIRLLTAERHLRPGGTVSGPSMFGLADITAYVATMAPIGRGLCMAATRKTTPIATTVAWLTTWP